MPRKKAADTAVLDAPPIPAIGFIATKQRLMGAIAQAARAVPSRPSHPVLGNLLIRFSVSDQQVHITSFDLAVGFDLVFPAEVTGDGEITLPSKLLSDIVSKLPDGSVSVTIADNYSATVAARSSRYQIQGMSAEEFTTLPSIARADAAEIDLPIGALYQVIGQVDYAASNDETKQILTGIHLVVRRDCEGNPIAIEMAATDGHRLALCTSSLDNSDADVDPTKELRFTLSGKSCQELNRILSALVSDESIRFVFSDRNNRDPVIEIRWGDNLLVARALDGQYPAYNQLIPRQFDRLMTIDRKPLLEALDRIAVIADQRSNHIIKFDLDASGGYLEITADAQDMGHGKEVIEEGVKISGESIVLAFNVKYLMETLKTITTTEVQIHLNTPLSPVTITPLGGPSATHLVMPVQVRS